MQQLSHTALIDVGSRARHFNRTELAAQLVRLRAYLRDFVAALSATHIAPPVIATLSPPLWEAAHVAWFAEWWCVRGAYNTADGETRADRDSVWADSDAFLNSNLIAHGARWHLPQLTPAATLDYLNHSLALTLAALDRTDETDAGLYPFRLAMFHEAMHLEALAWAAQTLAWPRPAWVRDSPAAVSGDYVGVSDAKLGAWFAYEAPAVLTGFTFDNERDGIRAEITESTIATRPVTNGNYLQFLLRERSAGESVTPPIYWRETAAGWEQRRFDRWLPLATDEPVIHVSAIEAERYCAAHGRRLPTEAESHALAVSGMMPFGNSVWEWTATPFAPYPGFSADRYREYSAPWFDGQHRVLRGGSYATLDIMHHASYRNYFLPHRSDVFAGFRTCSL